MCLAKAHVIKGPNAHQICLKCTQGLAAELMEKPFQKGWVDAEKSDTTCDFCTPPLPTSLFICESQDSLIDICDICVSEVRIAFEAESEPLHEWATLAPVVKSPCMFCQANQNETERCYLRGGQWICKICFERLESSVGAVTNKDSEIIR